MKKIQIGRKTANIITLGFNIIFYGYALWTDIRIGFALLVGFIVRIVVLLLLE
jgi:hypothetical protein